MECVGLKSFFNRVIVGGDFRVRDALLCLSLAVAGVAALVFGCHVLVNGVGSVGANLFGVVGITAGIGAFILIIRSSKKICANNITSQ